jgi:hypothetical protein
MIAFWLGGTIMVFAFHSSLLYIPSLFNGWNRGSPEMEAWNALRYLEDRNDWRPAQRTAHAAVCTSVVSTEVTADLLDTCTPSWRIESHRDGVPRLLDATHYSTASLGCSS